MDKSYQNIGTLTRQIQVYVNELAIFHGDIYGGFTVRANEITSRVLQLAIPPGASDAQRQALEQLKTWALSKGVEIAIEEIK